RGDVRRTPENHGGSAARPLHECLPGVVIMHSDEVQELKVYPIGDHLVVPVPRGRGEELRLHPASHAIPARPSPLATGPVERLAGGGTAPETLQTLLDQWER